MTHQKQVSVVGGGIAGLVAAITAAEGGASVTLHEAHRALGGRWRVTDGPFALHEGPHVIYKDGPTWAWLAERRLLGRTSRMPARALGRFYFRYQGRLRRRPPLGLLRVLAARGAAPVGASFTEWATARFDAGAARVAAAASGVGLFHPNPGELSAAFVLERLQRVFAMPPTVAYRQGGWGLLMDDLGAHARSRGVRILTGSRVEELPGGTTIVATSLPAARRLLRDDSLTWPSGQVGMLDLGLRASRRDAFVVSDLDGGGWLETFSVPDPSIAPMGCSVTQLQLPLHDGEAHADTIARLEDLADRCLPGWRGRLEYRRDSVARGRSGAVDYPGTSWRDRPAVDRGSGVYLVGDQVAAPGLLSEVSVSSALLAGRSAAAAGSAARHLARSVTAPAEEG